MVARRRHVVGPPMMGEGRGRTSIPFSSPSVQFVEFVEWVFLLDKISESIAFILGMGELFHVPRLFFLSSEAARRHNLQSLISFYLLSPDRKTQNTSPRVGAHWLLLESTNTSRRSMAW